MKLATLESKKREEQGKNKVKYLKRKGLVPSIVYGEKEANIPITVSLKELRSVYKGPRGSNTLIKLTYSEKEKTVEEIVISHAIEIHPITQDIIHVDFLRIKEGKEIEMRVPVKIIGAAPGVKMGGLLIRNRSSLKVLCLPKDIPDAIEVDVSSLELGDVIHISDIHNYPDVSFLSSEKVTVVAVQTPRGISEEEEDEAEGEEGAEGSTSESGDAKDKPSEGANSDASSE